MTRLARLLVRIFFRRVELEGGENLPHSGPVVLAANHINGLEAEYVPLPSVGHMDMIDPRGRAFGEILIRLETVFGSPPS
jgi:hypothetical protein